MSFYPVRLAFYFTGRGDLKQGKCLAKAVGKNIEQKALKSRYLLLA